MNGRGRQAFLSIAPKVGLGERGHLQKVGSLEKRKRVRVCQAWRALVSDRWPGIDSQSCASTSFHDITLPPSRFDPHVLLSQLSDTRCCSPVDGGGEEDITTGSASDMLLA
jgi:hypothetical protein